MKLTEFLNDDTCQIFLAIIVGIVICYFIFGSSGSCNRDGFSVGGPCELQDIQNMKRACCGGDVCDTGEISTCSQECADVYLDMHSDCIATFPDDSSRIRFNTLNESCRATNAGSQPVIDPSQPAQPPPLDQGQINTTRERELFRDVKRFAVDLLTPLAQNASFTRSNSVPPITELTEVENDLIVINQLVDAPGQGSAVVDDAEYPILLSTLQKYGVYVLYFDNSDMAGAYSDTDRSVIASLLNDGRMKLKSFDDQDTIADNNFGDVFSATALLTPEQIVEDLKELSDNVRPLPGGDKVDPFSEIFVTNEAGTSLNGFNISGDAATRNRGHITPIDGSFTMRGTPLTNGLHMIAGSPVTSESINAALTNRLAGNNVDYFAGSLDSLATLDTSNGKIMAVKPNNIALDSVNNNAPHKITVVLPDAVRGAPLSSDFTTAMTREFMLMGYDGLSANKQAYTVPIETTPEGYDLVSMKESMAKNYKNAQYLALIAAIGVRRNEEKIPAEIDFMSNTLINSSNQSVVVDLPTPENECLVSGGFGLANYLLDTSAAGKGTTKTLALYKTYIGGGREFAVDLTGPTITDNTTGVVYTGDANNFFYMPPIQNDPGGKKVIVVTLNNSDIRDIKTREAAYDRAEAERGYTCLEWEGDASLIGGGCPSGQRLTPERSELSIPAFLDDGVTEATPEVFCCSEQACDCGNEPTAAEFSAAPDIAIAQHNSCCGFRNDWPSISRLLSTNRLDDDYFFNTAIQNDETRNLLQRCCPQPGSNPGDGTFPYSASTMPPTENCNSRYSTDDCGGGQ